MMRPYERHLNYIRSITAIQIEHGLLEATPPRGTHKGPRKLYKSFQSHLANSRDLSQSIPKNIPPIGTSQEEGLNKDPLYGTIVPSKRSV